MIEITPMYVGSAIGVILILLGFCALLTQKIYIDPSTSAPSEIKVPFLGKMKANYPALIFVFLGCAIVVYGLTKYDDTQQVSWLIDGTIISDEPQINWQEGQLIVFPSEIESQIDPENGQFHVKLKIEEGKTVEDAVERIQYSHPIGSMIILPKTEFDLKHDGSESKLIAATNTSRRYRVQLNTVPGSE